MFKSYTRKSALKCYRNVIGIFKNHIADESIKWNVHKIPWIVDKKGQTSDMTANIGGGGGNMEIW